jgi:hypothetical protein
VALLVLVVPVLLPHHRDPDLGEARAAGFDEAAADRRGRRQFDRDDPVDRGVDVHTDPAVTLGQDFDELPGARDLDEAVGIGVQGPGAGQGPLDRVGLRVGLHRDRAQRADRGPVRGADPEPRGPVAGLLRLESDPQRLRRGRRLEAEVQARGLELPADRARGRDLDLDPGPHAQREAPRLVGARALPGAAGAAGADAGSGGRRAVRAQHQAVHEARSPEPGLDRDPGPGCFDRGRQQRVVLDLDGDQGRERADDDEAAVRLRLGAGEVRGRAAREPLVALAEQVPDQDAGAGDRLAVLVEDPADDEAAARQHVILWLGTGEDLGARPPAAAQRDAERPRSPSGWQREAPVRAGLDRGPALGLDPDPRERPAVLVENPAEDPAADRGLVVLGRGQGGQREEGGEDLPHGPEDSGCPRLRALSGRHSGSTEGAGPQRVGDNRFPTLCVAAQAATSRQLRACTIFTGSQSSTADSTLRKAACGISTLPTCFIRFLPFFCFSSSLRLRVMSPP